MSVEESSLSSLMCLDDTFCGFSVTRKFGICEMKIQAKEIVIIANSNKHYHDGSALLLNASSSMLWHD